MNVTACRDWPRRLKGAGFFSGQSGVKLLNRLRHREPGAQSFIGQLITGTGRRVGRSKIAVLSSTFSLETKLPSKSWGVVMMEREGERDHGINGPSCTASSSMKYTTDV
ncbi:hypothetical protein V6Z90_006461 [Aspergillus fumigatus]|jgi:hypothetical protein